MPRLARTFVSHTSRVRESSHGEAWPEHVTVDDMSTFWSERKQFEQFWDGGVDKAEALVFSWGHSDSETHPDRVTFTHTPLDFILDAPSETRHPADPMQWTTYGRISVGKTTTGTSFRRARNVQPGRNWRANGIANLYHVRATFMGNSVMDLYRHGIIGFGKHKTDVLTMQLAIVLRHAVSKHRATGGAQRFLTRATRVLSVNAVHQPDLIDVAEAAMAWRQSQHFGTAVHILRDEGLGVDLAEIYMPLNTDVGSVDDVSPQLNVGGFSKLLDWLSGDLLTAAGDLLLSDDERRQVYPKADPQAQRELPAAADADARPFVEQLQSALLRHVRQLDLTSDISGGETCPSCRKQPEAVRGCQLVNLTTSFAEFVGSSGQEGATARLLKSLLHIRRLAQGQVYNKHPQTKPMYCVAVMDALLRFSVALAAGLRDVCGGEPRSQAVADLRRAELGLLAFQVLHAVEADGSDRDGSVHKRFTRVTSMMCLGVVSWSVRAVNFQNCKSGLDRTGLISSSFVSVVSLLELYPHARFDILLAVANFLVLRKLQGGATAGFNQPHSTVDPDNEAGEGVKVHKSHAAKLISTLTSGPHRMVNKSREALKAVQGKAVTNYSTRKITRAFVDLQPWTLSELQSALALPCAPDGHYGILGLRWGLDKSILQTTDLVDQPDDLRSIFPWFLLLRNNMLAYLAKTNASIAICSTGVRGMKYDKHPLVGQMIPANVETFDGSVEPLVEYKVSGLKQLSGGKMTAVTIVGLGKQLLVDSSKHRSS